MTPDDRASPALVKPAVREVRRTLLIVLLSYDRRTILLERRPGQTVWWPLRVDVPPHDSYARAVHRWQRLWGRRSAMRRGSVTGRLSTGTALGRCDYLVVILKLSREEAPEVFSHFGRWWPITEVDPASAFPQELGTLLAGYVEGWIPDGSITLDA